MQGLPTRRVVTAVLAAAGMAGSLSLAMGQTQPPPGDQKVVPTPRSSPHDTSPKSRHAIPQDSYNAPIQQPSSPQGPQK